MPACPEFTFGHMNGTLSYRNDSPTRSGDIRIPSPSSRAGTYFSPMRMERPGGKNPRWCSGRGGAWALAYPFSLMVVFIFRFARDRREAVFRPAGQIRMDG